MGTELVDALMAELSATVGRALTRVPMGERPLVPVLAADAGCPLMECQELEEFRESFVPGILLWSPGPVREGLE